VANPHDHSLESTRFLERLASPDPQEAWNQFLTDYSPLIRQVILAFEEDFDLAGDCFLFVCEKLCQEKFRRLRRFKPEGSARFSTWLRVVVRNLYMDWHRKEFGRQQIFQTIRRLIPLDQEVFHAVYHQKLSKEDCYSHLLGRHRGVTLNLIEESLNRIQKALSSRQLWLLQTRRPKFESLENRAVDQQEVSSRQIADPRPDPETLASMNQQQTALERALGGLEAGQRLLLKLRFEQEITLQAIARLMNLKDAQTADRRIREILETLRKQLNLTSEARGKTGATSV
jgi:RNA polymerase sigma factor (sigma-70 family)